MLRTFMHNSHTSVANNNKAMNKLWTQMHNSYVSHIGYLGFISQNMFKCSIIPGQHTRTSVPVPSTYTKRENQVPFKEKWKKHKKSEISLKYGQNRTKIKKYT